MKTEKNIDLTARRAVIVGATSGIGREVATGLLREGWCIGVAGRRADKLQELQAICPERVHTAVIDVTAGDASVRLVQLIEALGGMQLFFLSSGIGFQNKVLDEFVELRTAQTNVVGFTRMVGAAYHYFACHGGGHLAVISSIAGTKGLGVAPAYSATKRFQNTYIDALDRQARMRGLHIRFTDIRPGFVATDLLGDGHHYPLLMKTEVVARHILKALKRQRRVVVIDRRYRLLVFFWRLIPRWLWVRMRVATVDK